MKGRTVAALHVLLALFFVAAGLAKLIGTEAMVRDTMAQVLAVVTSAFGPVLLTESRDVFGSYVPLFLATAGVSAALAVVGWRTRLPGRAVS